MSNKKVILSGTFNGGWLIQFESLKKNERKFFCSPINPHTPEFFAKLSDAINYAEDKGFIVQDVCHHHTIDPSWQMDEKMTQKLLNIRGSL